MNAQAKFSFDGIPTTQLLHRLRLTTNFLDSTVMADEIKAARAVIQIVVVELLARGVDEFCISAARHIPGWTEDMS